MLPLPDKNQVIQNMAKSWWKILCALLVVYSAIAGLYFPLKPGVESINHGKLNPNQKLTVDVNGYNTRFNQEQNLAFYLQDHKQLLKADSIIVVNASEAKAVFVLPEAFGSNTLHLIGTGEKDGLIVLTEAIIVDNAMVNKIYGLRKDALPNQNIKADYFGFPYQHNLYETSRNLYFHVPMWFGMIVLFSISVFFSIKSLLTSSALDDIKAVESVNIGVIFGTLGIVTGAVWAKFTWGAFWSFDVKQNFAAISLLLYFAYLILRNAIDEEQKRAKIAAIYNIFAFPMMVVLLFVLPRLSDSLHPGNGGNPGFNAYDLDSHMRMVFYPAVLGWILIGYWIYTLLVRVRVLEQNNLNHD